MILSLIGSKKYGLLRNLCAPSLSLAKATEIVLALEAEAKDTLELQGKKESEVNKLTKSNEKTNRLKEKVKSKPHCYRCGSSDHASTQSSFRNQSCVEMRESGTYPMRLGQQSTSQGGTKEENRKLPSFEMADELDDDNFIRCLEVNNVNQAVGEVIWVTPTVNGQTLKMELDTGSAVSTLPAQKYKEMFPNTPLVTTEAILKT